MTVLGVTKPPFTSVLMSEGPISRSVLSSPITATRSRMSAIPTDAEKGPDHGIDTICRGIDAAVAEAGLVNARGDSRGGIWPLPAQWISLPEC